MEPGDIVTVRSTGRRARIIGVLRGNRFQVEFMTETIGDPIDQDTVQSEQEEGIYGGSELEPFV